MRVAVNKNSLPLLTTPPLSPCSADPQIQRRGIGGQLLFLFAEITELEIAPHMCESSLKVCEFTVCCTENENGPPYMSPMGLTILTTTFHITEF